ncbi:MAG TPA: ankyrin repeat domain-containing protein [Chitinophagaceae bacterium]|nr:ankyrin repeat domain-containing protein [Chitinophagaceae bacterium]
MNENTITAFIRAATWHGDLTEADELLATHPGLGTATIHTAAITGNAQAVRHFLQQNPSGATVTAPPYGGNALVYLALSKYLRLHPQNSHHFVDAATALLNAGADPNSGFWSHNERREFETALYGAAGVAHNAPLTQLLLSRGADPNDVEAVYHSPETYDNGAMKALVETGKLTAGNLSIMLIRKLDWHDPSGLQYLLEHGADAGYQRSWGLYSLHHALARCNDNVLIERLLLYGADPNTISNGTSAIVMAAREGRADVLDLFAAKGFSVELKGVNRLIAACAYGNNSVAQSIIQESPALLQELRMKGAQLLPRFCLCGNLAGTKQLLDMGIDVNTPYTTGDGYYGIPGGSLPIHVAAWLHWPPIVQLLIDMGAMVDTPDSNGQTPLALAVKGCTQSYWTERRSPHAVKALLDAGASLQNISLPTGYGEIDVLIAEALSRR